MKLFILLVLAIALHAEDAKRPTLDEVLALPQFHSMEWLKRYPLAVQMAIVWDSRREDCPPFDGFVGFRESTIGGGCNVAYGLNAAVNLQNGSHNLCIGRDACPALVDQNWVIDLTWEGSSDDLSFHETIFINCLNGQGPLIPGQLYCGWRSRSR